MSYEEYAEELDGVTRSFDERLERLHKQEWVNPEGLRVYDEKTFLLLAVAGMGGSY